MREAKSYSIVDHALLHGGYLGRLTHAALSLYLFLVVVGDREGRSFYGEASIRGILRLGARDLDAVRAELIRERLVRYRPPYWWVESLTRAQPSAASPRSCAQSHTLSREDRPPCFQPTPIRRAVPEALRELIRSLEERS